MYNFLNCYLLEKYLYVVLYLDVKVMCEKISKKLVNDKDNKIDILLVL